ncbi:MAG: potassium channel family protein [Nitrospirota bacterium]
MGQQYAVIGLGRFGYSVVETLIKKEQEVLAIDIDSGKVEAVSDFVTYAVQCDATDESALKAISAQNVDVAVVGIGEDIEASILIVMTLKELGIKNIIAKAVTPIHGKVLANLGVTKVIFPERDVGIRLAHSLIAPNILEYLELYPGHSIMEIPVPKKLSGRNIKETQIRSIYGVNIIAIRKKVMKKDKDGIKREDIFNFNPSAEDVIEKDDIMVVIGKEEDLDRLSKLE